MSNSIPISDVQRTILCQTEAFEVVSILWSKQVPPLVCNLHNHGWSQCHVLIQEGTFENNLLAGVKAELRIFEVGQVISTPVGAAHQMRCLSESGRTLHVYTPKIAEHKEEDRKFNSLIDQSLKTSIQLGEAVRFDELTKLLSAIEKNSISTHSPYFMNQLFSGVHPQALVAEELIAKSKTTLATHEASPVFSRIENEIVEQLGALIGWNPGSRDGVSVPGGSAANFMAIQLAKQKTFPETKAEGLAGKVFKIFVSKEAHYSFQKAAVSMGFGTQAIVPVGTDETGKMDVTLLEKAILDAKKLGQIPLMVCATAGTTVYGSFDPIGEIHKICHYHSIWLHVDGAWGGPVLFSKTARRLIDKIETADSMTFDAHKLIGASLTCSFILTKHQGLLLEANDVSGADYLFHNSQSEESDRGKLSWQCGRRADSLSFWSIWKNLGTLGLGNLVDRLLSVRDESIAWIQRQERLDILKESSFLNLCVRVAPPSGASDKQWSIRVREELKRQNLAMVNYSSNETGAFLRLIIVHPQVTAEHIRNILKYALEVS